MGSATRKALEKSTAALASLGDGVTLQLGEQLLAAGRVIGGRRQLLAAVADRSADDSEKRALISRLFGALEPSAVSLLGDVTVSPWSSDDDLLAGIEELGIRAIARSSGSEAPIESELFELEKIVQSDSELEVALSSKLTSAQVKASIVERLIGTRASAATTAIVTHLVLQPRGRRIVPLLRRAAQIVADEHGYTIAVVTSAAPLSHAQLAELENNLSSHYGRRLRFNERVDARLLGGARVQVGTDVFDGSVQTRLAALKLQLAG